MLDGQFVFAVEDAVAGVLDDDGEELSGVAGAALDGLPVILGGRHGDLLTAGAMRPEPAGRDGHLQRLMRPGVVVAVDPPVDCVLRRGHLLERRDRPGRPAAPCRKILAALEDEIGLARGYAYQVLIDLALPWRLTIPLVEPQGDFGGRGNDPPARPYYTEARLSPAGQVALAAERGQLAPAPLGLINGNTHRQGTRPPFPPLPATAPIRQALARPRLPGRQTTDLVGRPAFTTGCTATGDLPALAAASASARW